MRIIVTCGPSYEPIDGARRITNFSTGRLGIFLSNHFATLGWDVLCLKGEQATCTDPLKGPELKAFSTNDNLAEILQQESVKGPVDAVFHASALCDFRVDHVETASGERIESAKFPSRVDGLRLILAPAAKVLPRLRGWFPHAFIAGWKYELVGNRQDALAKGWQQIHDAKTNACVVNGAAYGEGFGICQGTNKVEHIANLPLLATSLATQLEVGR